jgi:SAM-dependent methyltransferase
MTNQSRPHWESVYATKAPDRVSWYRPHLDVSLELLTKAGLSSHSRLIDIGGGASTLVDDLLARGTREITVVDLSEASLDIARHRLGERAAEVTWVAEDITAMVVPDESFDIWHDRAALHFLVAPEASQAYVRVAARAIARGGYALIGCFAADGPEQCSGLPVFRRDPEDIAALFGNDFSLIESRHELHYTPSGAPQSFGYALLRKNA